MTTRGRTSLFRGKTREVISITLTPRHRRLIDAASKRLVLTRADTIALLIHKYAATVTIPASLPTPNDDDDG